MKPLGRPRRSLEAATEFVAFRLTPTEVGALDNRVLKKSDELQALGYPAVVTRASYLRKLVLDDLRAAGLLSDSDPTPGGATKEAAPPPPAPARPEDRPHVWQKVADGYLDTDATKTRSRKLAAKKTARSAR
jgi:hypothetical protein